MNLKDASDKARDNSVNGKCWMVIQKEDGTFEAKPYVPNERPILVIFAPKIEEK